MWIYTYQSIITWKQTKCNKFLLSVFLYTFAASVHLSADRHLVPKLLFFTEFRENALLNNKKNTNYSGWKLSVPSLSLYQLCRFRSLWLLLRNWTFVFVLWSKKYVSSANFYIFLNHRVFLSNTPQLWTRGSWSNSHNSISLQLCGTSQELGPSSVDNKSELSPPWTFPLSDWNQKCLTTHLLFLNIICDYLQCK